MTHKWIRSPRAAALHAVTLLFIAGVGACGNLTVGGFGEATVAVSGDAPDPTPAPTPTPRMSVQPSSAPPSLTSHQTQLEGHVEVKFSLYMVAEGGDALQLGEDELEVSVDLRGESEAEPVDAQLIPATRYIELQMVFTDIRAEVEGLMVGGTPIAEIHVELDDVTLPVTRPLDLEVAPGESVRLVVDLNSLAWLEAVDPVNLTVDGAVFASLLDVSIQ
jgi:hypothetical protein